MAIVNVHEIVNRRGRLNPDLSREYERTWRIQTNSPNDGPATLLAWGGFRVLALPYSDPNGVVDRLAYCVGGIDLQPDEDDPLWWTATAHYSTKLDAQTYQTLQSAGLAPGTYDPGTFGFPADPGGVPGAPSPGQQAAETSPLDEPQTVEWDVVEYSRILHLSKDYPAKAIANSAGVPFDPLPDSPTAGLALTVTRNEASFDKSRALAYHDTVNAAVWNDFGVGLARCRGIRGRNAFRNGVEYWQVVYRFEVRREGWKLKKLDAGYQYLNAAGKLVTYFDAAGQPTPNPIMLDGHGAVKDSGTAPVELSFTMFESADFSALGITV